MPRQPVNLSASIHQRLLNLSQARNNEFNQVLTLFAIERLLYRLAQSPHAGRFILKGALLFLVWDIPVHRPTRDLDLLGFGTNSATALTQLFQELCALSVIDDGLIFDMKDFYNIWVLSRLFPFDGAILSQAIEATFAQRKSALPLTLPTALTPEFADHPFKIAQWRGFLKRNQLEVEGASFVAIIAHLHGFLWPPLQALVQDDAFNERWIHPEGWR